jgi:hypothetical protein
MHSPVSLLLWRSQARPAAGHQSPKRARLGEEAAQPVQEDAGSALFGLACYDSD